MNQQIFETTPLSIIDVTGADAATIIHNLTTNTVVGLETGQGNECFVTDVRGKTLGHVSLYRRDNLIRLIGPGGQSERIAQHVDRYTIREDATAVIRDDDFSSVVIAPQLAGELAPGLVEDTVLREVEIAIANTKAHLYGCRWLGEGSGVLLFEAADRDSILRELSSRRGGELGDERHFHQCRIRARFPWYGIDLDETNLPQEADRDSVAISFTKGCYLGQETVARLDALGQVQKKLVNWSIQGGVPEPGIALKAGEKTVGRLTSVAAEGDQGAIAIGPARRSHFDVGSTAEGVLDPGSIKITATVN